MRKIYLASDSKARKELLKIFGVKFIVLPGRVKEKMPRGSPSYLGLVKKNALAKAKDASVRVKSGVIIAADTIVVQDKKIFGKPRNFKAARQMLKTLSRKPQWLYTAIAVIDKDSGKVLLDHEKTKVYMDKLTDAQISRYFQRVSPLDKAGSFDIQGRGAFFIRRIEGCFYNVVGLPVRKLYQMLKKVGVNTWGILICILSLSTGALLSGCSTEYNIATGHEETYLAVYDTDKEEKMGQAIAKQIDEELKMTDDPLIQQRVREIGKKIVKVCDRKDINYEFNVLEDDEVNAVSLPGGYIYVNSGLVKRVANDDELAAVLAHEVAHIVARHSIKKLQAVQAYSLLMMVAAQVPSKSTGSVASAADAAFTELLLGYSREDELLADKLGARYTKMAGYNPRAMISFLEKLQAIERRKPAQEINYYKTHPYVPDRIRVVKQELGERMDFGDYINIEQLPHAEE